MGRQYKCGLVAPHAQSVPTRPAHQPHKPFVSLVYQLADGSAVRCKEPNLVMRGLRAAPQRPSVMPPKKDDTHSAEVQQAPRCSKGVVAEQ